MTRRACILLILHAGAAALLVVAGPAFATSFAIRPHTEQSADRRYLLVQLTPFPYDDPSDVAGTAIASKYRQSGLYLNDGSTTPLWTANWWTVSGGYYVHVDGAYAVTLDALDPTLAFHHNGIAFSSYQRTDLLGIPEFLDDWIHGGVDWRRAQGTLDNEAYLFHVSTIYHSYYTFDIRTGRMVRSFSLPMTVFWVLLAMNLSVLTIYVRWRRRAWRRASAPPVQPAIAVT